jgi:hypothetical protein
VSKRRITAAELLTLADAVSSLSAESGHVTQYGAVTEKLNSALASVLDAARSVAFQEAREAHNRASLPKAPPMEEKRWTWRDANESEVARGLCCLGGRCDGEGCACACHPNTSNASAEQPEGPCQAEECWSCSCGAEMRGSFHSCTTCHKRRSEGARQLRDPSVTAEQVADAVRTPDDGDPNASTNVAPVCDCDWMETQPDLGHHQTCPAWTSNLPKDVCPITGDEVDNSVTPHCPDCERLRASHGFGFAAYIADRLREASVGRMAIEEEPEVRVMRVLQRHFPASTALCAIATSEIVKLPTFVPPTTSSLGAVTEKTCPCGNGDVGTPHSCGMGQHCEWHRRGYEAGKLAERHSPGSWKPQETPLTSPEPCRACGETEAPRAYFYAPRPACLDGVTCLARQKAGHGFDLVQRNPDSPRRSPDSIQGHNEPCYFCGRACNALAGNPGEWPIPLCHADEPGVVKWHHTSCVQERLRPPTASCAWPGCKEPNGGRMDARTAQLAGRNEGELLRAPYCCGDHAREHEREQHKISGVGGGSGSYSPRRETQHMAGNEALASLVWTESTRCAFVSTGNQRCRRVVHGGLDHEFDPADVK